MTVWEPPEGASSRVLRLAHQASRPLEASKSARDVHGRALEALAECSEAKLTDYQMMFEY
jgi:hypothetical protein